jgi:flagellar FliL protein
MADDDDDLGEEASGDDDDEASGDETGEDEDEDGDEKKSSGGGNKMLIIIVAVVLLLIGGGAAAFFMGLLDPLLGVEESAKAKPVAAKGSDGTAAEGEAPAGAAVFYDLPEMMVNLNSSGRKPNFLKIKVALDVPSPEDIPKLEAVLPRVIDSFQVYLRELRIDDLKGSAGMYRLREELLTRVNAAIAPTKINAVLFKEMLVQ